MPCCGLLSQLLIRGKTSRYLFYLWFSPRLATFRCLFFLEVLASAPSALRGLCGGSHILTGTWSNQLETCREGRHRLDEVSGKKWKPKGSGTLWDADWKRFTDSQFFLCCSFIWKGIRLISPNCAVMLWGAALWSVPTVEWQLTEDEQPLNLVFRWIKCFFCFSCPALLHSHFEPAASFLLMVLCFLQSWA